MSIFYRDDEVTIIRNPTAARMDAIFRKSSYSLIRGILAEDGDLFVWDADSKTHVTIEEDFDVFGTRLDLAPETVNVVLAGGARELLDSPEQVAEFFQGHGHPGATLLDDEIVSAICDAETARIMAAKSLKRAMPNIHTCVVDIDPRIDWEDVQRRTVDEYHNAAPSP